MQATVGDRIIVKGPRTGIPNRDGEIIAIRGPDGEPPYVVRWSDSGHETLFFPGSDAELHHFAHPPDA
jgi:Domain of unknown function (DUF1918)